MLRSVGGARRSQICGSALCRRFFSVAAARAFKRPFSVAAARPDTRDNNLLDGFCSTDIAAQKTPERPSGVPTPTLTKAQLFGKSTLLKRFYEKVEVRPDTTNTNLFRLFLDNNVVKTPDGNDLRIPSREIADLIRL